MYEFKGVVNFNTKGEVVCFCSEKEVLQGKCGCRDRYDCPEALVTIEVIPGSKPSEKKVRDIKKTGQEIIQDFSKIKESLVRFEKSIKGSKFRI